MLNYTAKSYKLQINAFEIPSKIVKKYPETLKVDLYNFYALAIPEWFLTKLSRSEIFGLWKKYVWSFATLRSLGSAYIDNGCERNRIDRNQGWFTTATKKQLNVDASEIFGQTVLQVISRNSYCSNSRVKVKEKEGKQENCAAGCDSTEINVITILWQRNYCRDVLTSLLHALVYGCDKHKTFFTTFRLFLFSTVQEGILVRPQGLNSLLACLATVISILKIVIQKMDDVWWV